MEEKYKIDVAVFRYSIIHDFCKWNKAESWRKRKTVHGKV